MADRPRKQRPTRRQPVTPPSAIAVALPPREPAAFLRHILALTNRRAEIRTLVAEELARLQPPPRPGTQPTVAPGIKRQAYLKALQTWHSAASARLEDLQSGRTGTGPDAQPIPPSQQSEVANLTRRLVVGLSKNAARISTLEGAQRRWHAAAKATRESIRLRRDTAREVLGGPLRPDARLHLQLAHATFMLEGNSPRVRKELQDAAALMPKSKGLAYWLARYEVMAGHYTAAYEATTDARDYPAIRHTIMPLLEPESADAPWLSWPCNFYTYRYTLAETPELLGMQEALAALSNNT